MNNSRIVTVDGPAGSGKSTLGRALSEVLGLPLIDTGLFYRAVMVAAVRAGLDAGDPDALARLAAATTVEVSTEPDASEEAVLVNGEPAGGLLRDPRHAALLAAIAGTPGVRDAVIAAQRAPAVDGAVAVGRDCGTVVFPGAAVKFYLDAPERVREQRRVAQLRARGADADGSTIRAEVGGRDRADTERAVSPLRPAADAHRVDTAAMGIDAMVAAALAVCAEAGLTAVRPQ